MKYIYNLELTCVFTRFSTDEDGELVTFSSDEELVEALGSIEGDVFRVYIRAVDGQEDTQGRL